MTADDRLGTISRAIDLIDTAYPGDLAGYLAQTEIHDHLKADPATLRDSLASAASSGRVFSAWKAAQQLLRAAGLPYQHTGQFEGRGEPYVEVYV